MPEKNETEGTNMNLEWVQALADVLKQCSFDGPFETELQLEERVGVLLQRYLIEKMNIPEAEVLDHFYIHGKDKAGKRKWSQSKKLQNVTVFGCKNTGDIFFQHPKTGSLFVEVKFSKQKNARANGLPGGLQRAIGQSLIASLKHDAVLCFVGFHGRRRDPQDDGSRKLCETLWKNHQIALVVREV